MKGQPTDLLVFECMFPKPKACDPQNFQAFLQRHLIPEVRQETHAFYGHLDTHEAKYPGLDYSHPTHRIRLGRWTWHRRLFRAFDALGLTEAEIAALTKWEGTRWAKEKYEKEQGIVIRDTAADGFPDWRDPIDLGLYVPQLQPQVQVLPDSNEREDDDEEDDDDDDDDDDDENMDSDEELESVGVELNNRLRAQAARREAGETSVVLDEEWEQWLKNAIETGELAHLTEGMNEDMFHSAGPPSLVPSAIIPTGVLEGARAGRWSDFPETVQAMLQRALDTELSTRNEVDPLRAPRSALQDLNRRREESAAQQPGLAWPRRFFSELRLPAGEAAPQEQY